MKINFENKVFIKTIDNIFIILLLLPLAVLVLLSFSAFLLLISARIFFFLALLSLSPIFFDYKENSKWRMGPSKPF